VTRRGEAPAALRRRIREGPLLIFDAAMGTELERRGAAGALPLWSAAALLDAPRTVFDIHRTKDAQKFDDADTESLRNKDRVSYKEIEADIPLRGPRDAECGAGAALA